MDALDFVDLMSMDKPPVLTVESRRAAALAGAERTCYNEPDEALPLDRRDLERK